jgi:hypothetical protein
MKYDKDELGGLFPPSEFNQENLLFHNNNNKH